jgi:DNA-directed RNA polymerase subunit K/omega
MIDRIVAKRALELQLKGVPRTKALTIANQQVQRDSGLIPSSNPLPV